MCIEFVIQVLKQKNAHVSFPVGMVLCNFGGGGTYYRVRPPKPVLEGSKNGIGLVCARFLKGK